MVHLRRPSDDVVENSVFGVWKVPVESMRVIWSLNLSNPLFRPESPGFNLPTPDVLSTLRVYAADELFVTGSGISPI